ncbi:hypothetical protein C7408_103343 [Paraburkholderia caballeronis]|nr:hypothetical protein C7408_103343 [Paraburkholderia caballeronis]TDV19877.1 hypothetical protein C7406_10398 [Paraburkholderia caballeronis]TDV28094.1 hypothetical protein C7404_10398 [Paraburkholderia caballeronis]TDV37216.1 hypothetical protein C7405_103344 [Paraburkholderia caballeronis]
MKKGRAMRPFVDPEAGQSARGAAPGNPRQWSVFDAAASISARASFAS